VVNRRPGAAIPRHRSVAQLPSIPDGNALTFREHDQFASQHCIAQHAAGNSLFHPVVFYSNRHMTLLHKRPRHEYRVDFGCFPAHHGVPLQQPCERGRT
jgi:hypothetical protein